MKRKPITTTLDEKAIIKAKLLGAIENKKLNEIIEDALAEFFNVRKEMLKEYMQPNVE
jgi:hypothetical protein